MPRGCGRKRTSDSTTRERSAELDRAYVQQFAKRIRELFPHCPDGREVEIAEHACRKYSGRVGRSASAKSFDDRAILLAVAAHVRHREQITINSWQSKQDAPLQDLK